MNPRELIRLTAARFRAAGVPDPENDAALLLAHLTGKPALALRLETDTDVDASVRAAYDKLVLRRLDRYPLQYILGEAPFCNRIFKVDPRVLIPRPETELLCEWALELLSGVSFPRVLDLCCGSGCLGLTVKAERPDASVTLSDLSGDALNVTAVNAARFSLDVSVVQSDLFRDLAGSCFDLILSNPPYIPSGLCDSLQPEVRAEPLLALDGGSDGCDLYRRIISTAPAFLSDGGKLLMELGINEADYLADILENAGWRNIVIRRDYAGVDRMILAMKP